MRKILCFGDSNTFGFNPANGARLGADARWSGILQTLCRGKFEIVEAGCNNRTAFSKNPAGREFTGIEILPELLTSDLEFVVIAAGINDLQPQYKTTETALKSGITNLLKLVKSKLPNSKIILIIPPVLGAEVLVSPLFSMLFDESSIQKSKSIAKIYREVSIAENCDFIDLNGVATPSVRDGLHFEPSEHAKIARKIFEHLSA